MSKLEIKHLSKSFEDFNILRDISCVLPHGTITGFVGNNGAGKTTLIKCLTSFYDDYTGEISVGDNSIYRVEEKISYIPDNPVYYEELTLAEHLKFISAMYENAYKIEELVEKLDMRKYLNNFPQELSKGTLQRMMIILSLLRNYEILIADEPFNGLDPSQVSNLKELFISLKNQGITILISSHQLSIVQEICDRYILIDNGKVVYETPIQNNLSEVSNENIEALYNKFLQKKVEDE